MRMTSGAQVPSRRAPSSSKRVGRKQSTLHPSDSVLAELWYFARSSRSMTVKGSECGYSFASGSTPARRAESRRRGPTCRRHESETLRPTLALP